MGRRTTGLIAIATLQLAFARPVAASAPPPESALPPVYNVVVAGVSRYTQPHTQRLYLLGAQGLTQISPEDGAWYDWPNWAMNGSKLVYTRRSDEPLALMPPGQESVWMVNADGSTNVQQLTSNNWRDYQPKVSADGKTLIFSSMWSEYPNVGIYAMSLATFDVRNLSAVTRPTGSSDADPRLASDGRIIFASSLDVNGNDHRTQIFLIKPDGTGRTRLATDNYLDVDPSMSPDGRYLAFSSYRGGQQLATNHPLPVKDWDIVIADLQTGTETLLTHGKSCVEQPDDQPCAPMDASAWAPVWSPAGDEIGFIAHLSWHRSGVYAMHPDGTGARTIFESPDIVPNYWDWSMPGQQAPANAAAPIGAGVSSTRMLVGGPTFRIDPGTDVPAQLYITTRDRWNQVNGPTPNHAPTNARWTPDRKHIVYVARIPFDAGNPTYGPAPPPGQTRHEHYVLGSLADSLQPAARVAADAALEQIFIMDAGGGNERQLTTPWTEDWLEAIGPGDARANTDPDVSPDGRYIAFTNSSSRTSESFILRMDLQTGEVINLTAITSGAVATADSFPRWSPDRKHIAFSSVTGKTLQIFEMDADGTNVRQLIDDDFVNIEPAWSPDGQSLVYTSYRGNQPLDNIDDQGGQAVKHKLPLDGWDLFKVDVASLVTTQLVALPDRPALRPVWSPEGDRIAFITLGAGGTPDVYAVDQAGGTPYPLQSTSLTKEEFVDWR